MSGSALAFPTPASLGSLDHYIQAVNRFPLLTAEQEVALGRRWKNHEDVDAARQLVLSHLRLVVAVSRNYLGYGLPQADLIQEGNIGLMKAVHRFDPERGVRLVSFALAGADPIMMLTAPIPATAKALEKAGLTIDQMDSVEINEAFASVVLAWEKEHHPDMSKVNPNGGAIALGHPLGCSGAKLMATLVNELERTGGRYGLQTMCEGGGMANATVIERLG